MFLLVPAYPGCPGSKAVKRSLNGRCCYGGLLSPVKSCDKQLSANLNDVLLMLKVTVGVAAAFALAMIFHMILLVMACLTS